MVRIILLLIINLHYFENKHLLSQNRKQHDEELASVRR